MTEKRIDLVCKMCGKFFSKLHAEYTRQCKEHDNPNFFCSGSCSSRYRILINDIRSKPIVKSCALCGIVFTSSTHNKKINVKYCSRSCASQASVTDKRRESARISGSRNKGNLAPIDEALRKREWPKYKSIDVYLTDMHISHVFEYRLDQYVYDLFIPALRLLIEFDGREHRTKSQKSIDNKKDLCAQRYNLEVARLMVTKDEPLPYNVSLIKNIIYEKRFNG